MDTPVQYVKGVGPRLGAVFASRGIATVGNLISFFPRTYEDRTKISTLSEIVAPPGLPRESVDLRPNASTTEKVTIPVKVVSKRVIPIRSRGTSILEAICEDPRGDRLSLKWFHAPRGLETRLTAGTALVVTGKPKIYQGRPEFIHPEMTFGNESVQSAFSQLGQRDPKAGLKPQQPPQQPRPPGATLGFPSETTAAPAAADRDFGRIVPIYVEIEGVPTRLLRRVLWEALEKYGPDIADDLPPALVRKHSLPSARSAAQEVHFPSEATTLEALLAIATPAQQRIIYEEFFKFQYLILRQRLRLEREKAHALDPAQARSAADALTALLPFTLTGGQKQAVEEILKDLGRSHPMSRLVQGDVGSGKTAVAMITAGALLAEGYQAALLCPTEILAEQHLRSARSLFQGRLNAVSITGSTPAKDRKLLAERLSGGEPILVIGTHAILEDWVRFKNLAYVLIDEQHRFGVDQRAKLFRKGAPYRPHGLVLSATPIPRTLALTAYGDLSVSSIRERPPGRIPVVTKLFRGNRDAAYARIRQELAAGHQAFFIYPLVDESEAEGFEDLKSAIAEAERLAREVFPEFKVELLHGRMKAEEKDAVMARFKNREAQILVSTTVIEVGIDIPNATVLVVEHADRFGLSQLHQLRGRVGRGSAQSYFFLFSHPRTGESTTQRLEVLERTSDGFEVAEADLRIRGPGEFMGTRQAGSLPFKVGEIVRDRDWLLKARDDAESLLRSDPELLAPENQNLRRYFQREGGRQSERLSTS